MTAALNLFRRTMTRPYLLIVIAFLSFVLLLSYFKSDLRPLNSSIAEPAPPPKILIYNRIPKTASTTLMHLPYELAKPNGFNVLLLNITRSQHMLTMSDQIFFGQNITRWREKRPAIYHGHFAYVDFDRLGVSSAEGIRPIYINMVRKPLDRLVSYYYFLRYGDDFRVNKIRSRMGDKMTFDECVEKRLSDCDPKKMWLQIPWFCGHIKKVRAEIR